MPVALACNIPDPPELEVEAAAPPLLEIETGDGLPPEVSAGRLARILNRAVVVDDAGPKFLPNDVSAVIVPPMPTPEEQLQDLVGRPATQATLAMANRIVRDNYQLHVQQRGPALIENNYVARDTSLWELDNGAGPRGWYPLTTATTTSTVSYTTGATATYMLNTTGAGTYTLGATTLAGGTGLDTFDPATGEAVIYIGDAEFYDATTTRQIGHPTYLRRYHWVRDDAHGMTFKLEPVYTSPEEKARHERELRLHVKREKLKQNLTGPLLSSHRGGMARDANAGRMWADDNPYSPNGPEEMLALQLLRKMVTQEDFRRYLKSGRLNVRGDSGLVYEIVRERGATGRGITVWDKGEKLAGLCIHLKTQAPPTDHVVAKMLIVQHDEPDIWSKSNITWYAKEVGRRSALVKLGVRIPEPHETLLGFNLTVNGNVVVQNTTVNWVTVAA